MIQDKHIAALPASSLHLISFYMQTLFLRLIRSGVYAPVMQRKRPAARAKKRILEAVGEAL